MMTALLVALPGIARAEDVTAGKALFDRGLADMVAGRLKAACPSLAESYKLDPRPGTLFTLAECEAKRGRVATAVERYDEYISQYGRLSRDKQEQQGRRRAIALEQRATLAPRVAHLTLLLAPDSLPGTTVTRDGREVAPGMIGLELPVDPGDHVLTVKAPAGPPLDVPVTLGAGEKKLLTLPRPPATQPVSARRVGAVVAGAIGVVGLLVGAVAGGLTLAKKSVINAHCTFPGDAYGCDQTGLSATTTAKTLSVASTAGFVVAGVGVATGAALFFSEPRGPTGSSGALAGAVFTTGRCDMSFALRGVW